MKLIGLFFLIFIETLWSQNTLYVEYEETVSLIPNKEFVYKSVLISTGATSYFTKYANNAKNKGLHEITKSDDGEYALFKIVDAGDSSTIIVDKTENIVKQTLLHQNKPIIIEDTTIELHWEFLNETKMIQNFNCSKATINFRGRHFIAWYTEQIPVSSGPWKFYGLPGLILEVYDADNLFIWQAKKVEYPFKNDIKVEDFDFSKYQSFTLEAYTNGLEEKRITDEKIMMSKMPKDHKIISTTVERKGLELVYEWELEDDKKH